MPRTKHIVVFFALLIALLIAAAVFLTLRDAGIALYGGEQTALLVQSEVPVPVVVVERDTSREETRASLRAALEGYESSGEEQPEVVTDDGGVEEHMTLEPLVDAPHPLSPILFCDGTSVPAVPTDTWGPVSATLAEGARVIASLERNELGGPKYRLQLSATPNVTPTPQCLPQGGVVGVARDGHIIVSDTPFDAAVEGIVGYAVDGFGIFGMYEDGSVVTSTDLDQCHGHVHTIVWDGVPMSLYHYHVTSESPYTLGCFRGTPVTIN